VQRSAAAVAWATVGARFITLTSASSAALVPHPVSQQSALQPQSSDPQLPSQQPSAQQPDARHSSPQQPAAQHCPADSAQQSTTATAAVSTQHAAPSTQHASFARQQSGKAASFAVQQDCTAGAVSDAVLAAPSEVNPATASSAVAITESPETPRNFANMWFRLLCMSGRICFLPDGFGWMSATETRPRREAIPGRFRQENRGLRPKRDLNRFRV
jgi:hypothetical protein